MKKEYAEEVATRIIEQLEQGTAPWQKPWQPGELRLPYNPTTGKDYRGMNSLWLHAQGRSDPRWMTYNQAASEGAQVRKGSKGTPILYWKFTEEQKVTDEQGQPVLNPETGKPKTLTVSLERPRSFMAVVFNAEQIDGLPPLEVRPLGPEPERHARAEAILAHSGAEIQHQAGDRAFYRPSTDRITLPERAQFSTADAYYATALHELGHWTGHPSRLERDLSHPFGSEGYAREELRAELASLMLGERLEIGHDPRQHAAYVGSWIKVLKEDPKEIFRAAADAERISSYVMQFEQEQTQAQTTEVPMMSEPKSIENQAAHYGTSVVTDNQSRTYLAVPYVERQQAKALGAQWDKEAKSWYAPAGVDLDTSGLAHWALTAAPEGIKPPLAQFKQALKAAGLQLKGAVVSDGKMQRLPVEGDKAGATSGAYAYHETGRTPGGFIQNYKSGQVVHWKPEGKIPALTAAEQAQQRQEANQQRQARLEQQHAVHMATAKAAQALWQEAPSATAEHPYCAVKSINQPLGVRVVPEQISAQAAAHGIRIAHTAKEAKMLREADPKHRVFNAGDLLIPARDTEGTLWTLQSVNPGFKSFMKGGRKAGLYAVAGTDDPQKALAAHPNSPVVLAEGYATADTLSRLLNATPIIVAFDCGNLEAVARDLREHHPNRPLLIAADNDHTAKTNTGLLKAHAVAKAYGCGVMEPPFQAGEQGSDWNDLAALKGDEVTRKALAEQMAVAKATAAVNLNALMQDKEALKQPLVIPEKPNALKSPTAQPTPPLKKARSKNGLDLG